MKSSLLAVLALLGSTGLVHAQQMPTLREALQQTLDAGVKACPLPDQFQNSNLPAARTKYLAAQTNVAMCECYPRKIRSALETTSGEVLSRQVTLDEMKAFNFKLVEPCMGAMFRELFSGEQCLAMVPEPGKKAAPKDFCACMKPEIAKFTDAEAIELSAAAREYRAAADEARKAGKPAPPRPATIQRFKELADRCAAAPRKG